MKLKWRVRMPKLAAFSGKGILKKRGLSIRMKILLSSLPIIVILSLFFLYSKQVGEENQQARSEMELYQATEVAFYNVLIDVSNSANRARELLIDGYSTGVDNDIGKSISDIQWQIDQIDNSIKENPVLKDNDKLGILFRLTKITVQNLVKIHEKDIVQLKEAGVDPIKKQFAYSELKGSLQKLAQGSVSIRKANAAVFEENKKAVAVSLEESSSLMSTLSIVSLLIVIIVPIISSLWISSNLGRGIRAIVERVREFSEGQLNTEFDTTRKDELGQISQSLAFMSDNLKGIISTIMEQCRLLENQSNRMVDEVGILSQGSQQVFQSVDTVKGRVDSQNQSLSNISAITEELSATVQEVSASSQVIVSSAEETTQAAQGGLSQLQEVVSRILDGNERIGLLLKSTEQLTVGMKRIQDTTKQINDITGQTHILSLNAAIEAARTGEAGKGFAVIADEIRKLADQTRTLSDEIGGLIKQITKDTNAVLDEVTATVHSAEHNVKLGHETMESFRHIVSLNEALTEQIQEISRGSNEMATGTTETATSVSEISDSTEELVEQFNRVRDVVEGQTKSLEGLADNAKRLHEISRVLESTTTKFTS